MAITTWNATALTGGATRALDAIPTASLTDGDRAFVANASILYFYVFDSSATNAESSPDYIRPDDYSTSGVWVLHNIYSNVVANVPPTGVEVTGNVYGMILSPDTDAQHDVNITAGSCLDSTATVLLSHGTEMTKQIDAAWAAGDDAGGMLNGTVAVSERYDFYALYKDSDGSVDFGFLDKDDAIATYLPSGYSYYRWVGSMFTDASANIVDFIHELDDVFCYGPGLAIEILTNVTTATLVAQDLTAFIPAGRTLWVEIGGKDNGGDVWYSSSSTSGSEANRYETVLGTNWSAIQSDNANDNVIARVMPDSSGNIYIDTASTSTDIMMSRVKLIR